jgi:3-phenylpropionate/trans-cinnamate dioxygenase ferredoxin subunit
MTRQVVAKASEVAPGTCKIVSVRGREIGIFNLGGEYFALANRCPHAGGPLCRGMITPLVQSDGPGHYRLARQNEFIRCPWHGWEFDIRSGQSWCDPNSMKVRQYAITVEPGEQLVKGPFVAETFPVTVEDDYLVVDLAGRPEQRDAARSA